MKRSSRTPVWRELGATPLPAGVRPGGCERQRLVIVGAGRLSQPVSYAGSSLNTVDTVPDGSAPGEGHPGHAPRAAASGGRRGGR